MMRHFLVAGGRSSQGWISGRPFARLLLFAAAVLLSAIHQSQECAAYNVSLESVTLFKRFSWHGTPSIYIECDSANRTYLPAVNSTLTWFTFQGNESWQPVTQLEHGQCRTCALYERLALWYKDGCFGTWAVCSGNFSDRDSRGLFTFLQPASFHANLACYACNHTGTTHATAEAPTTKETDGEVGVFVWMSVIVAGMGIVIIIAACSVFLAAEPEAEAERVRLEGERAKFIEMGGEKSDSRPRFHDGYHYEGSEDGDRVEHKQQQQQQQQQQQRAGFTGRFRDETADVLSDIDEEEAEEETTGLFPMHHTHSSAVPGLPRRAEAQIPVSSAPASAAATGGMGIAAASGPTTAPRGGAARESPTSVEVSILQSPPGRPFETTTTSTTAASYYHEW
ncbi:hypothetical protein CLOP_g11957 [Closterium sp. NIES-67]|nr:hypothetical protein CLOP_g11957 [Closterium sp. NIES-67]